MINSMMHERTTRKWFCYNFIITIIGMMLRTIVVVVAAIARRLLTTVDRITADVASINNVVIVAIECGNCRGIWMQRMVLRMRMMMMVGDDER